LCESFESFAIANCLIELVRFGFSLESFMPLCGTWDDENGA
jgi:hypothetical protein